MIPSTLWQARLRRLLVAALLGAALAGHAQTPDCPPVATQPSPAAVQTLIHDARDHGYLWRITKDGRTSWLYGTLHVARLDWAFPGPSVAKALAAVDALALEIDPLDPSMQQRIAQSLVAMRGPALPPALSERLEARRRAECLPPQPFGGLAPVAQVLVLTTLVGRRDGIDPAYGIDLTLAGLGRATKIAVISLETPEQQVAALESGTEADTLARLDANLADMESGAARAQLDRLARAWADGDLQALTSYSEWCHCLDTEPDRALMRAVLDDRNPTLAAGIAELHASGSRVFAAVGSLHMVGERGLPALLEARGFHVERIAPVP